MITVTIRHNTARDGEGRRTTMLDGYQPGAPMVAVFTYQADPAGGPESVAGDALGIFNGHPPCASDAGLARAYYQRKLRSLSFPGNSPCCGRWCCLHRYAVRPGLSARPGERMPCVRRAGTRTSRR